MAKRVEDQLADPPRRSADRLVPAEGPALRTWLVTWQQDQFPSTIEAETYTMADGDAAQRETVSFSKDGRVIAVLAPGSWTSIMELEPEPEMEPEMAAADEPMVGDAHLIGHLLTLGAEPWPTREEGRIAADPVDRPSGRGLGRHCYRVAQAGGGADVVRADELVEYTDGTFSFRIGDETVGLGSRDKIASIVLVW